MNNNRDAYLLVRDLWPIFLYNNHILYPDILNNENITILIAYNL